MDAEAQMKILGVPWFDLPIEVRRMYWRETDYNRRPPSPEFMARLPELLAVEQAKVEDDKRELAAELAAGLKLLRQAREPPCEQCLRPHAPCRVRCLRSIGVTDRPESETIRRNPYVDLASAPPWLQTILHEHFHDPNKVLIEDLEARIETLRAPAREREPVMPIFLFVREPDVEREGGFLLAGQLVFVRNDTKWSLDEQEKRVAEIVIPLIDAAEAGTLPPAGMTWGWPKGTEHNAALTNDEARILPWMRERRAIKIRVPPGGMFAHPTRH
jgi:hypothetical protein